MCPQIFKRLHTDNEYAGISLAIVKKAVEKMGGMLRFESAAGKGSTFYLNLPNTIFEGDTAAALA